MIDRLSEWGIEFCKYSQAVECVCKKGELGFTLDVSNTIRAKTDDASYILTFYKKRILGTNETAIILYHLFRFQKW